MPPTVRLTETETNSKVINFVLFVAVDAIENDGVQHSTIVFPALPSA